MVAYLFSALENMGSLMTETVLYGMAVSLTSLLCLFSDDEHFTPSLVVSCLMTLVWANNTFMWLIDAIHYFIYVDLILVAIALRMWSMTRIRWLFYLAVCFTANVFLDALYLNNLISYGWFAWPSNGLFIIELGLACHRGVRKLIVSWRTSIPAY